MEIDVLFLSKENTMELDLPFAYTAIMLKHKTFLGAASTLPQLIENLRSDYLDWQESHEGDEPEEVGEYDAFVADWSNLGDLVIWAHVNGDCSIDVDQHIYFGQEGMERIRQGDQPQQFLEIENIPTHWPTVEQQQEILAQFRGG